MAIWGPQEVLGTYQKKLRLFPRATMHVVAGPPVDLADLYERPITREVLQQATDRIMATLTGLLEEVRGEKAPTTRFDPRAVGIPTKGNPTKEQR